MGSTGCAAPREMKSRGKRARAFGTIYRYSHAAADLEGGKSCPQPAFSRLWPPRKASPEGTPGQDWPPSRVVFDRARVLRTRSSRGARHYVYLARAVARARASAEPAGLRAGASLSSRLTTRINCPTSPALL